MNAQRQPAPRRWSRGLGAAAVIMLGMIAPGAFAQQAPAPSLEEEIRAFCGNIADAARDQRYLLQKKELEDLQAGVDERIRLLEERTLKYRDWLKKREDFMRVADTQLVEIYKNMAPDSAAAQLEIVKPGIAAAIVMKLSPRLASQILNEMDTKKAAALASILAAAAAPEQTADPS
jgi:flagellar motility protein MotE (MotC chaperone)